MKFGLREILMIVAMLGLLVSSYVFVFAKENAQRRALVDDTAAMRLALTNLSAATAGVDDVGKKVEQLQQAIDFFRKRLPQEKEVDAILTEISPIAEANSLTIKTVRPLRVERSASYSEQPIELVCSGDFNGFYSFLLQLEKMPRITRITQMQLNKIDERDGEMTAKLTLSIFFEPDDAATAAAQ